MGMGQRAVTIVNAVNAVTVVNIVRRERHTPLRVHMSVPLMP